MKASELIDQLTVLITTHGDQEVHLTDWNEGYREPMEATLITFNHDTGAFVLDVSD